MKIIRDEIRPIGFLTIEMSENELQAITGAFEELCYIKRITFKEMGGIRQEVYDCFQKHLNKKSNP